MKRIELQPPHQIGKRSIGVIRLANGMKTAFQPATKLDVEWPISLGKRDLRPSVRGGRHRTHQVIWIVEAEGFAANILGRLFATIYRRSLDKAIPRLVAEMNSTSANDGGAAMETTGTES